MFKAKKVLTSLFMAAIVGLGLATIDTQVAYATTTTKTDCTIAANKDLAECKTTGGLNDFGVTIDANGNITINGADFAVSNNRTSAWANLIEKYRYVVVGISGIGTVSMILFFVWNTIKLGQASGDPGARSKATVGLIWSGVAAMLLGSATLIVGMFYGALR